MRKTHSIRGAGTTSPPKESELTVEKALSIARGLKYGPTARASDPTPSVEEAIEIIHEERGSCGFNWITGERAEELLREE